MCTRLLIEDLEKVVKYMSLVSARGKSGVKINSLESSA